MEQLPKELWTWPSLLLQIPTMKPSSSIGFPSSSADSLPNSSSVLVCPMDLRLAVSHSVPVATGECRAMRNPSFRHKFPQIMGNITVNIHPKPFSLHMSYIHNPSAIYSKYTVYINEIHRLYRRWIMNIINLLIFNSLRFIINPFGIRV